MLKEREMTRKQEKKNPGPDKAVGDRVSVSAVSLRCVVVCVAACTTGSMCRDCSVGDGMCMWKCDRRKEMAVLTCSMHSYRLSCHEEQ